MSLSIGGENLAESFSTKVRIVPARPEDAPAVEAFNARMRAAGVGHQLAVSRPFPDYVLHNGSPVLLERFFAWVDGELRGGVVVKRMPFWTAGAGASEVAFFCHPVSEGVVNPEFGFLGLTLQKFVARRCPLVYGLGTGGLEQPVARLMVAGGWEAQPVPFRFRVFHAAPFLRNIEFLRRRHALARGLADLAAFTGLGALGLALLHLGLALAGRRFRQTGFHREAVSTWGAWADDLWRQAREHYALIGDRSASTLATLYPDGHPHLRRLRVLNPAGEVVGWAVVSVAQQRNSPYFGQMNLGALVDCLARPGAELPVVSHALAAMRELGADLAVTNHSATAVLRACDRAGMLPGPTNYFLFLAPALRRRVEPARAAGRSVYFTRGDGDGPIHLW